MTVIEIVLLCLGALIFAASFIIPEKLSNSRRDSSAGMGGAVNDIDAREMVETMKEDIDRQVRLAVDSSAEAAVEDAVLRSERNIERVTNEKMMAIDEYAQTVMQDINKNHKEVVFLYDMLENKTADIKNTVRKAENTKSDIEEAGRKVRSELEAIAKRSAETVIANSAKAKTRKAAEPERDMQQVQPMQPIQPEAETAVPESKAETAASYEAPVREEPRVLRPVTSLPEAPVNPEARSEVRAEAIRREAEAVEHSMKEKGVPKLGRALAAAFAQASLENAAQEEAAAYEENAIYENSTAYEGSAPVEVNTAYDSSAAYDSGAAYDKNSAYEEEPSYMEALASLQEAVPEPEAAFQPEAAPEPENEGGDIIFSDTDDLQGLVVSMYRKGIDEVEIAKRLSIGVGEVRLMVELYGK
ncbi:MAG: hypothetical protein J6O71_04795 [Lachnospiraceae bacterium]|nr:hypothetical protein [Lachnospiraceae bacterium]